MLNQVSALIPYKSDNGWRDQLFYWVKKFYETTMPEVELCIGKTNKELFNRSEGINLAARQATKDIFVIADSDIIFEPKIIRKAVQMLNQHAWVVPYNRIFDITEADTNKLLEQLPQWPLSKSIEMKDRLKNKAYKPTGGLTVVNRENFIRVKGFDERFEGWGREDDAFRHTINTICGPFKRMSGSIYHLWHPKVGVKGNSNMRNNNQLIARYKQSRGNVKEMEKLIKEHNSFS